MQRKDGKRLLISKATFLITHPDIAIELGRSEAVFIQQLHYWLTTDLNIGCFFEDKRWIYNTYEEWKQQLKIFSLSTIRRIVKKLEQLQIISTKKLGKKRSDQTKWYTINYETLSELIPPSREKLPVFILNRWTVQNEQIINKEAEITSENKLISSEAAVFVKPKKSSQQVNIVEKRVNFDNKNNLATELLGIWNQTVGERGVLAQLTKKRSQHLVAAFKFKFESKLEAWKHFCQQITTSDFLMGKINETFRASLDWVLKFDVIQRIVEGDFGIKIPSTLKGISSSSCEKSCLEEMITEIDSKTETIEVKELRRKILHKYGTTLYKSWFKNLSIQRGQEGRGLQLQAPSLFVKDWIQTNYLDDIQRLSPHIINISYGWKCG